MNAQDVASPLVAAELPSRDNGTWVINADGTMRTTWKIKPNAKWHDGQPVTGADFAFAFQVYSDPSLPARPAIEREMERVEALDAKTFAIDWKRLYPWASELQQGQLEPLPSHILATTYGAGDPQAFVNQSFWSSPEYVGTGPYRLVDWDRGSQLVYRAFDNFFLGRPKIDEVVVRIIADENATVASVLAGELDATLGTAIGLRAGLTIKERWSQGEGTVIFTPARWNYAEIQFDPARNGTPGLLDLRVRRAMMHGTDREALSDAATGGAYPIVADIPIAAEDPLYPELSRSVTKYPYDPRRALALLEEAGWVQRGEALVNARGEPFSMEMRSLPGSGLPELDMKIMAGDLRKLGMQITEELITPSRAGDLEYRVTFPGLNVTQRGSLLPSILTYLTTEQCATTAGRFVGGNRGCWTNAEFDGFYRTAFNSLEPAERARAEMDAVRVLTDQLGAFGISLSLDTIPVRKGLVGPQPRAGLTTTWNVFEWQWVD
jgi:peptide/nickel transport system substrate-binding protein